MSEKIYPIKYQYNGKKYIKTSPLLNFLIIPFEMLSIGRISSAPDKNTFEYCGY